MRFSQIEEFLYRAWRHSGEATPPTVLVLGPPGIGKSSIADAVALRMTKDGASPIVEVIDLTSRLPEDLGGLPFRDGDTTVYCPQQWMRNLSKPGADGVLVLDDLPASTPAIAAACRQIALTRSINGVRLAAGVLVVVTGNRPKDSSGAMTLPSHFRNAVCLVDLEPSLADWVRWFLARGGDMTITQFLQWKPRLFSQHPSDADLKGSFATPRTWTMLSDHMRVAEESSVLPAVASGLVGEGTAQEFMVFCEQSRALPAIIDLLQNPQSALPHPEEVLTTPDRMIGATCGLGQMAAMLKSEATCTLLLRALHWVTRHNREYVAAAVDAYETAGGVMDHLRLAALRLRKEDKQIDKMLASMKRDLA